MFSTLQTQRTFHKILSIFLMAALLLAAMPFTDNAQAACAKSYVVVAGDTVSGIALKYGVTVEAVAAENSLKEPYSLVVGQTLCIPASSSGTGTGTGTTTTTTTTGTQKKSPSFTAYRYPNHIEVELDRYPKQAIYYVTLDTSLREAGGKMRIGRIRTNKEGSGFLYYKLDKKMRQENILWVCLKNVRSNSTTCVQTIPVEVNVKE